MGNACIVMSDPHAACGSADDDEASTSSTQSSRSSGSSHGSFGLTKRWVSSRLMAAKRARGSALDSPVWQRGILMGERCEPPDFSGVIMYDEHGNHVPHLPCRSSKISVQDSALQLVI